MNKRTPFRSGTTRLKNARVKTPMRTGNRGLGVSERALKHSKKDFTNKTANKVYQRALKNERYATKTARKNVVTQNRTVRQVNNRAARNIRAIGNAAAQNVATLAALKQTQKSIDQVTQNLVNGGTTQPLNPVTGTVQGGEQSTDVQNGGITGFENMPSTGNTFR